MEPLFDPRVISSTVIDGPPDLVGEPIIAGRLYSIDGRDIALVKTVAGVVPYASAAINEAKSIELHANLSMNLDERSHVPWQNDVELVVSWEAAASTTVKASIEAIEMFVSHHIVRLADPSDDKLDYDGLRLTPHELRNQYRTLDEALRAVLPALLDRPSPTAQSWWPVFRRIQALAAVQRHAVTEPHKRKGLSEEKEIVQRYLDREHVGASAMVLQVFEHFAPGWVGADRLPRLPQPPQAD